jgi:tripartite-type tricarboxylate transporter receptor subunit TctC
MLRQWLPVLLMLAPAVAWAETFPAKAVTMVVPFSAGGPLDAEARLLGQFLSQKWGKPVTIEPRPGAGGLIGTEYVVKAAPDGHTLLFSTATLASFKIFYKDLRFDPLKDLAPVSMVIDFPGGFVINTKVPARTIEEFIAYARANPGKVNYGSLGRSTPKLLFEQFAREAGIKMTDIPYNGTAAATTALIRDDVQLANITLNQPTKQLVDAGQVRALLLIGTRRAKVFPDVPTSAEKGWNIPSNGWSGILAPAETPKPIVNQISADIGQYAAAYRAGQVTPDTGVEKISSTPDEMRRIIEDSMRTWGVTAAAVGISPE